MLGCGTMVSSMYRLHWVGVGTVLGCGRGVGVWVACAVEVTGVGVPKIKLLVSNSSRVTSPFIADTLVGLSLGLLSLRISASWILVWRMVILSSRSWAAVSGVSAGVGLLGW